MRTTVSATASLAQPAHRVTCETCADVVPSTRSRWLNDEWHCLPCAEGIMRLELVELATALRG